MERKFIKNNNDALKAETIPLQTSNIALHKKVEKMKEMFYTIEDGKYCEKLFELFGKERVEKELEIFLGYDFFPRFGGGIGMTRLARAYEMMKSEKEVEELA